jgi:hypothetical protein
LKLQPGTYRISANYLNYSRPLTVNPKFENYIASSIEADSESRPLPGDRYGGYLLEVKRERQITLTIRVVPDEELNSQGADQR